MIGVDLAGSDVEADLGTTEGRAAAVRAVIERGGGVLDGLVTCAGLGPTSTRPGSSLVSVNYFGTVVVLEGLRPALARSASGSAVAIGSNSATIQPGVALGVTQACLADEELTARRLADEAGAVATYPATKLAIAHYVRSRATVADWAVAGLRLNAIAPGMVATPLVDEGRADPELGPLLDALPIPLGRPGQPVEIAALVALLLSGEGGFFCGSVLYVDGGTDALLRTTDWPAPFVLAPRSGGRPGTA